MHYSIVITPTAIKDIQFAVDYYNDKSENLGYRFAELVDEYFQRIAILPTGSGIRYKNVRCKPMATFPYLIMYTIDESNESIKILRIFNTYQHPLW